MEIITEITDIRNAVFRDSAFAFSQMLDRKVSGVFDRTKIEMYEHPSFLEAVIPTSDQMMAEDLTQILQDNLDLHIMYATEENNGKIIKVVAYSTPEENHMAIVYLSSTMYGVADFITVHFFDSVEVMYLYLSRAYRMMTTIPACILEKQERGDILKAFI